MAPREVTEHFDRLEQLITAREAYCYKKWEEQLRADWAARRAQDVKI